MELHFVGHASVVLDTADARILTDPWLRGTAFNDAWAVWPPPALDDELLGRVTHLWISHEHPDHLSIPSLKAIPAERRAGITLLFQRHWQPEIALFLRTLGFREVVEVPHGETVTVGAGTQLTVFQVGHEDSALVVRSGERTVLDLNDCKPSDAVLASLVRSVGPVDVLLDQFSIAGWPGNPEDTDRIEAARRRSLETMRRHADVVRPRWVVPFASFVRFCHVENEYMNAAVNTPADALDCIGGGRVAVLYPGDSWDLAGAFGGTADAVERYELAAKEAGSQELVRHDAVPVAEVIDAAEAWLAGIQRSFHRPLLRRFAPVDFELTDTGDRFTLDLASGAVEPGCRGDTSVVEVSSQAARYTFAHRWGVPTLLISGRLRLRGPEKPFQRFKQLGSAHSTGLGSRTLPSTMLDRRLAATAWRRRRDVLSVVAGRLR